MGLLDFVVEALPYISLIIGVWVIGGVFTTWLRIRHGYPLETGWGKALHPKADKEAMERIKLLTNENARLRAELGSLKDRLENVERIITDRPSRLAREIDALTVDHGGTA